MIKDEYKESASSRPAERRQTAPEPIPELTGAVVTVDLGDGRTISAHYEVIPAPIASDPDNVVFVYSALVNGKLVRGRHWQSLLAKRNFVQNAIREMDHQR